MIRTIVAVVVLMAAIFFIGKAGINRNQEADAAGTAGESQSAPVQPVMNAAEPGAKYTKEPEMKIDQNKQYVATMDTTEGKIVLELYPKIAPHHVNSFVFLSREGFYNNVPFHRVIKGFMIQGGDPTGTGMGGPGYQLKAEFNNLKHTRGVLSAARSQNPNSAGSQFFIMHQDSPHLDNNYTAYGKVLEGMDVVDKIVSLPTGAQDRPVNLPRIKGITIEEK